MGRVRCGQLLLVGDAMSLLYHMDKRLKHYLVIRQHHRRVREENMPSVIQLLCYAGYVAHGSEPAKGTPGTQHPNMPGAVLVWLEMTICIS